MHRREVLEEKLQDAKERYKKECETNKSAWEMYGSELSAGNMIANEEKILEEAKHYGALLAMPEADANRETLDEAQDLILGEISGIDSEINELKERISELEKIKEEKQARIALIDELKEIPLEA